MAPVRVWWPAVLLGLTTIGAYGTAYYSIGVLIPAISEDTGWRTGSLSTSFSLAMLGQGAIALIAGRVFDRRGSRPVLLSSICAGAALLLVSTLAKSPSQFILAWALGSAAIGGGLYYNVTMPITARLYPDNRAAAFSVLTLLGALASPIFYPIARLAQRVLGLAHRTANARFVYGPLHCTRRVCGEGAGRASFRSGSRLLERGPSGHGSSGCVSRLTRLCPRGAGQRRPLAPPGGRDRSSRPLTSHGILCRRRAALFRSRDGSCWRR